jgi:hypothetical protein
MAASVGLGSSWADLETPWPTASRASRWTALRLRQTALRSCSVEIGDAARIAGSHEVDPDRKMAEALPHVAAASVRLTSLSAR